MTEPQREPSSPSAPDAQAFLATYGSQILCLMHPQTGCAQLSPNFKTITGIAPEACLQAGFYAQLHADFRKRFQQLLHTHATASKPHLFRCKLLHADQHYYWYQFVIHPKKTPYGEFVCIIDNIHEQMQTQHTLQKARLEAELALRARSEFLANMSHELRTPLNAVIGFSEIIESEIFGKIDNPHYSAYIRHIQESGYDLLTKIEDLLEISNIDAGRVTLTKNHVFAGDMLRQVADAQAHQALQAEVTLISTPPAEDVPLYVDRLKLQHSLGHLVANAIKFTAPHGRVVLSMQKTAQQGVLIRISDTGSGISAARLEQITAILQEENCWMAQHKRGVSSHACIGLGLALTKEFVALHGGTVALASAPGMGTTVEIRLPNACIYSPAHAAAIDLSAYVQTAPHMVN